MSEKKLKILMLNYEFPPLGGGAGNATYYILKKFAKLDNICVDLITSSTDKFEYQKFSQNINIYKLDIGKRGNIHYQSNKDIMIYTIKSYFFTRKLLHQKKYNLVHTFFAVPCGFIGYLFKKKIPYIISVRGSDVPGYNARFSGLYKILSLLIKKVSKNSKAVIANSQDLKKLALKTLPNQKIDIIYNGIDTGEFKPRNKKNSNNSFNVLCVSRLIERKGIKYLILALPEVIKKYQDLNLKLTIIGEGNLKKDLENLVKDKNLSKFVDFKGLIEHSQLPLYYNQADIFVLPSLNEGMSNAVLEAISSGLPIITTDTGGTLELVKDNGFVVPKENSKAIAEAVGKLIKDKDLRLEMGGRSREIAERFEWGKIKEQYLEIYKTV